MPYPKEISYKYKTIPVALVNLEFTGVEYRELYSRFIEL
jgi:hypothetical protein